MDFSNLNSEQIRAVKHIEGPLLILAGAGSGKTTTMTHRIAYMLEQGVDPRSILAVTFTNKAAGEMRSRVENLTGSTRGMWIMTFHAMCLRMLRFQSDRLGYKEGFTVYDESDKKALIKRIYKALEIDEKQHSVSGSIAMISKCKEQAMDPEDFKCEHAYLMPEDKVHYEVYKAYRTEMMSNNAMDFDDLLWNGVRLLEENQDILDYYSEKFRYIMVDEYQDTNYLQYKLIKMLASRHGNLCVVGDDDQCIYQWRGADIRNILDFESDFKNTETIKLEQNYRSDANILGLANSVIKNNRGRKSKALWTEKEDGEKITYKQLDDEKLEAWYVGGEIERWREQGYNYRDCAVLYRKNAQSRPFEEKFSFRRIPYRVLGGTKFYDRKEIKDVTSYLRLVENPDDDVAMLRVINEPKRGMGPKAISGITNYAKAYDISVYAALCEPQVRATLSRKSAALVEDFLQMIQDIRGERDNLTIEDIYDNILNRSGYLKALEDANTIEADGRIENIMEFKSAIKEFEKGLEDGSIQEMQEELAAEKAALLGEGLAAEEPSLLACFLERITLMAEIDNHDAEEDAVTLMTLHSAKGLEFPIVFMPGMEQGVFPGPAAAEDAVMEEERRLCYVGITRAMKKLYLTSARTRMLYGRTDYTVESPFLEEMDKELLDGDKLMSERKIKGGGFDGEGGLYGEYFFGKRTLGTADGYSGAPKGKPFDSLKQSTLETKEKIAESQDFEIGDTLKHPKFGEGLLIEQDAKTLSIMFDSVGMRKIAKGYVKIEKIN
ncbi:MAG: UvrD-helicase domain-containing protein [Firmicutes bacterium]|nr:UvrD-helicase domain-containing protein [Bacillota bacterium]